MITKKKDNKDNKELIEFHLMNEKYKQMKNSVASNEVRLGHIKSDIIEKKKDLDNLLVQESNLLADIQSFEKNKEQAEVNFKRKREEFEAKRNECTRLDAVIREKCKYAVLQDKQLEKDNKKHDEDYKKCVEMQEKTLKELKAGKTKLSEENQVVEKHIADKEAKIEELDKMLEDLKKITNGLNEEISDSSKENKKLNDVFSNLSKQIESQKTIISNLKKEKSQIKLDIINLKKSIVNLENTSSALQEQYDDITKREFVFSSRKNLLKEKERFIKDKFRLADIPYN